MRQHDPKLLRQVLREAVEALLASGWAKRGLERRLGIGHGNLDKLLDGRLRLTLDHLLAFAAALDVPPSELVALAYPEAEATAKRRLSQWVARRSPGERAAASAPPTSRAELEELLRATLRDELDRRGLTAPVDGGNGGSAPGL